MDVITFMQDRYKPSNDHNTFHRYIFNEFLGHKLNMVENPILFQWNQITFDQHGRTIIPNALKIAFKNAISFILDPAPIKSFDYKQDTNPTTKQLMNIAPNPMTSTNNSSSNNNKPRKKLMLKMPTLLKQKNDKKNAKIIEGK